MGASPQPVKSLIHRAVSLLEELHLWGHTGRTGGPSRWLPLNQVSGQPPSWLVAHGNRDLAARVAFGLARKTSSKVGYLAVGECAIHAVMRMWLLMAGVEAAKVQAGELEDAEFVPLVVVAGKIAKSNLIFSDQDVPPGSIAQIAGQFIEENQLGFLVVDDPDVATLRNPELPREEERWRVRKEFQEAVRGTGVGLILPG